MRALFGSAALAACVFAGSSAQALPNTSCKLATPVQEVNEVAQLAPEVRKLLAPMADPGGAFNKTDSVIDPSLPARRLIRAGHRANDWFVWYEHGGIAYYWQAVVVRIPPGGGEVRVLANASTIADTLCTLTDGALSGRVPPYPPGTSEAKYY